MVKSRLLLSVVFFCVAINANAQFTGSYDPTIDPRVTYRELYEHYAARGDEAAEDNCNENNYLRWLNNWYWKLQPDGTPKNFINSRTAGFSQPMQRAAKTTYAPKPWQSLGPETTPPSVGIGRINCITFHPTRRGTIYAGAPAGGFWKTTDSGAHWITNTDQFASIGVSDIALDPLHPDTMYAATGDRHLWDCTSTGLLKSTDGGNTWRTTGLSFPQSDGRELMRVIVDPANTSIIYVAEKTGYHGQVYKSRDGGATWISLFSVSEEITDMRMHPTHNNQLYLATNHGTVYRTRDSGSTWVDITSNIHYSSTATHGSVLSVTPAAPDNLYVLREGVPDTADLGCGVYLSQDGGNSFAKRANNATATAVGWYGYAMDVSPTNPARMYVGGGYAYQSDDTGRTFTPIANSSYGNYLHVDIHDIRFRSNNEVFVCSDGGIYWCKKLDSTYWNWTPIAGGMAISEVYGFGSASNSKKLINMGMQDNGSGTVRGDKLFHYYQGGDGMQCAIDPADSNIYYNSSQVGSFNVSRDGGATWAAMINQSTTGEGGAWTTPLYLIPSQRGALWTGYASAWKSNNFGVTWHALGAIPPNRVSAPIKHIYAAPTDTNIIYASFEWGFGMWKTIDNGRHWSVVNYPSVPLDNFTVDSTNPYHLWATSPSNVDTARVYESVDSGQTWRNITYNLPNVHTNPIAYENNGLHRLFVGTSMGVYYLQGPTDTTWKLFGSGLPNTPTTQLEIHAFTHTLRVATYGRGLWQCSLDTGSTLGAPDLIAAAPRYQVFPNPAKQSITLTGDGPINKIVLTNLQGQVLFEENKPSGITNLDVSTLAPGLYFLRINNLIVVKVLKE